MAVTTLLWGMAAGRGAGILPGGGPSGNKTPELGQSERARTGKTGNRFVDVVKKGFNIFKNSWIKFTTAAVTLWAYTADSTWFKTLRGWMAKGRSQLRVGTKAVGTAAMAHPGLTALLASLAAVSVVIYNHADKVKEATVHFDENMRDLQAKHGLAEIALLSADTEEAKAELREHHAELERLMQELIDTRVGAERRAQAYEDYDKLPPVMPGTAESRFMRSKY